MISILIPVYNKQITELVTELQRQIVSKHIACEFIIADDASTNLEIRQANRKTAEKLRIKYIQLEENLGRTKTRTYLAQLSTADYLLFLDADVMPGNNDFLKNYLQAITPNVDLVYGGVAYHQTPPKDEELLRWKYGIKKEVQQLQTRKNDPYQSIISMGFLIKKSLFLELSGVLDSTAYGMDNVFSFQLKQKKAKVIHIDNPVIHLGLEQNDVFFKKSLASIETTILAEKEHLLPNNFRPVQRTYLKLIRTGMIVPFMMIMKALKKSFEVGVIQNANVVKLDVLKLYHYAQLKQHG
ncbi:glycosyltransferase [Gangjinia marincola]|uniref:Glycosyltransferase n=1 Tax=Gangjinia marincola TaxID=578463 RepID=A0ABP3XSE9_9FLAO